MKFVKNTFIVAAVFAFGTAHADTLSVDVDPLGPAFDYTATLATPSQSITASPFQVTNLSNATSFLAFCLEPFVPLSTTALSLAGNTTYSAATPFNMTAVSALYNSYFNNSFTPVEAAAFQFALWELVTEASLAPNLLDGSFAFANAADPAVVRGQQMLSSISPTNAPGTAYNLFQYTTSNIPDRSQNLIAAVAVPEPGTYALMVFGLAVVGAAARRRKV